MRLVLLIPAGAAVLALAGCSSSPASSVAGSNRSASAPTTKPTPTPTLSVGTDLAACGTGSCVVRVSAASRITFKEPELGLGALRVVSVKGGVATIETTSTTNGGGGTIYSGGDVCDFDSDNGDTTDHMGAGCHLTNNGLSLSVLSVDGDTALLRLERAS